MVMDFSSGNVTLFHGDALRVLTTLTDASVDAALTDPPYSSGGLFQYPPMPGDNRDQRSWILWFTLWLSECWRIARAGAPLMVFTDWRQLPALTDAVQAAGWAWRGIAAWDKRSARPQIGKFRHQCEYVVFAARGAFYRPYTGLPARGVLLPGDRGAEAPSDQQAGDAD